MKLKRLLIPKANKNLGGHLKIDFHLEIHFAVNSKYLQVSVNSS